MNYLIYTSSGEIIGVRIALPKKEENVLSIPLNQQNQNLYETLIKPKVLNGNIVESATAQEIIYFNNLKIKN
jgi:hypothetical protein